MQGKKRGKREGKVGDNSGPWVGSNKSSREGGGKEQGGGKVLKNLLLWRSKILGDYAEEKEFRKFSGGIGALLGLGKS